eukprot:1341413-Pyramimonas_sp.AAC.1
MCIRDRLRRGRSEGGCCPLPDPRPRYCQRRAVWSTPSGMVNVERYGQTPSGTSVRSARLRSTVRTPS